MICDASNESFQGSPKRLNVLDDVLTEGKSLNSTKADISLGLWRIHLEGQSMSTMEEEDFEVLDLRVGKQNNVFAKVRAWLCSSHIHSERSLVDCFILESNLLEAASFVSCFRIL